MSHSCNATRVLACARWAKDKDELFDSCTYAKHGTPSNPKTTIPVLLEPSKVKVDTYSGLVLSREGVVCIAVCEQKQRAKWSEVLLWLLLVHCIQAALPVSPHQTHRLMKLVLPVAGSPSTSTFSTRSRGGAPSTVAADAMVVDGVLRKSASPPRLSTCSITNESADAEVECQPKLITFTPHLHHEYRFAVQAVVAVHF